MLLFGVIILREISVIRDNRKSFIWQLAVDVFDYYNVIFWNVVFFFASICHIGSGWSGESERLTGKKDEYEDEFKLTKRRTGCWYDTTSRDWEGCGESKRKRE